jgi:SAM-dependent methyltransferase
VVKGAAMTVTIDTVAPASREEIAMVARLHMELLRHGPMARLGVRFLERFCYGVLLEEGLLHAALCRVDGEPAGFISYTPRSIQFHREVIRRRWLGAARAFGQSLLHEPAVLLRLPKALRLMADRRREIELASDPLGEVVSIGVLRRFATARVAGAGTPPLSEALILHAAAYLRRAGATRLRMIVEARNKPTLLLYHRLGAGFQPYQQMGEPMVHVWFDLAQSFPEAKPDVPACWDAEPSANGAGANGWTAYWQGVPELRRVFRHEAAEYVRRLQRAVELPNEARVLDFGCGFGFVAELLAPRVAEVAVWDAAHSMRSRARVNLAHVPNVRFVDLSAGSALGEQDRFDLILVNSVIQYMDRDELRSCLGAWHRLLRPGGKVVLSDLLPEQHRLSWDLLGFAWRELRHGSGLRVMVHHLREFQRYRRSLHHKPLLAISCAELRRFAAEAGLAAVALCDSLTHRRDRGAYVLTQQLDSASCPLTNTSNLTS